MLATTVGHFVGDIDLDFANVYILWLVPLVSFPVVFSNGKGRLREDGRRCCMLTGLKPIHHT